MDTGNGLLDYLFTLVLLAIAVSFLIWGIALSARSKVIGGSIIILISFILLAFVLSTGRVNPLVSNEDQKRKIPIHAGIPSRYFNRH